VCSGGTYDTHDTYINNKELILTMKKGFVNVADAHHFILAFPVATSCRKPVPLVALFKVGKPVHHVEVPIKTMEPVKDGFPLGSSIKSVPRQAPMNL
jgi:hypothetical protein